MIVEYLFEISPFTLILCMLTLIFLIGRGTTQKDVKEKVVYQEIPIEFKKYQNESDEKKTILVMSYNIMSYNFTKYEWFPYCSPAHLDPKYRAPRIVAEIEKLNPDILCLQECDYDLFIDFYKLNLESLGYTTVYKTSTSNRIVTNVIAYKKELFKEVSFKQIELSEGLDKLDDSFNKHKEALILTLQHKESGKSVQVVNTHLYWNPEYEYVKYGQLAKIFEIIQCDNPSKAPIILCGDLNSTPSSNVLKYVYKERPVLTTNQKGDFNKNKKFIEQFYNESMHSLKIRSAYDSYKVDDISEPKKYQENHPDFTTYTDEFSGNIDYILYTENLRLIEVLKLPTSDAKIKSDKLPNERYPSDHLKIAARFELN